jgi:hypothetical protein
MKGTIYAVIAEVVARFWAWRTLRTLRNQRRGKLIPARCAVPRWSAVTPPSRALVLPQLPVINTRQAD